MHDRPTAAELVAATRHYLETELLPTLADARLRFQTLVAANVLGIVERELRVEEQHLVEELQGPRPESLAALRQAVRNANEALCARIRRGEFDDAERFRALLAQLRPGVKRKLEVANPRYLV
jgi:hypothetical protein